MRTIEIIPSEIFYIIENPWPKIDVTESRIHYFKKYIIYLAVLGESTRNSL